MISFGYLFFHNRIRLFIILSFLVLFMNITATVKQYKPLRALKTSIPIVNEDLSTELEGMEWIKSELEKMDSSQRSLFFGILIVDDETQLFF